VAFYVNVSLQGGNAVGTSKKISTFRRNILFPTSGLKVEEYVSPKLWYLSTIPHGVTTQKNNIDLSSPP
jgi:hypothetical protein